LLINFRLYHFLTNVNVKKINFLFLCVLYIFRNFNLFLMKLTRLLMLLLLLSLKGFSQQFVLTSSGEKVVLSSTGDAGTLTGTTLKSTVLASSLTSVGTLTSLTVSNTLTTNSGINSTGTITNTGSIINTGKIAIGALSAASSSAVLEVSSTTQGFLPPRMTYAQRDAITSPSQGLMVYCTDCGPNGEPQFYNGVAWVNLIGAAATTPPPTLGMSYQGGIIFYILQSGDNGYVAGQTHGLIAATSDQSSGIGVKWSDYYTAIGTLSETIGTGSANTTNIINSPIGNSTNYAAGLARAYRGGGYNDWYVPSINELNELYNSRSYFVGNSSFSDGIYWSSSEFADWAAFTRGLVGGGDGVRSRGETHILRAIRSF
jgi:hypothetical protein